MQSARSLPEVPLEASSHRLQVGQILSASCPRKGRKSCDGDARNDPCGQKIWPKISWLRQNKRMAERIGTDSAIIVQLSQYRVLGCAASTERLQER